MTRREPIAPATHLLMAVFPVPEFHALACPACQRYKMRPHTVASVQGFKCRDAKCSHFMSTLQAELFIGMEMVAE